MKKVKLSEISELKNGINYKKTEIKNPCKILSVADFKDRYYADYNDLGTVDASLLSEEDYLHNNDIVFVRSNGNKALVGRTLFIENLSERVTFSGFCIRLRIVSPDVDAKYLYYLTKTNLFKAKFGKTQQTNINNLSQNILNEIEIDLPEIDEQRRIAKALDLYTKKIQSNTAICSDLEAMAKLLYDYWFVQFDFPDENGKPYKSSGGKMVWNEELKREIPEGWEVKTVEEIAVLQQEAVFPVNGVKYSHYSIPSFDESQMPAFEDGEDIASNKYNVYDNTVLVSKLNPQFKRLWLIIKPQENAICSTEFLPILAKSTGLYFLFEMLNSDAYSIHLRQKASSSTGSRKRIDPENCMSFQFAFNEEVAMIYNEKISSWMQQANRIPIENQQLASLRDFLLPMLMNGQVKVGKEASGAGS